MAKDRACGLRLIGQAKRQICLNQTLERLRGVGRCLELLDNHTEAVDRGSVMTLLEVVAADFHLFRGEMVEGEIEFENRRARVFTLGILLDHVAQRLQREEGQALIAANLVNLIIIGQREEIFRVSGILVTG